MNKFLKVLLGFPFLLSLSRFTTVRPASLGQAFKKDTVYVKSIIVNNPTATIQGIKIITVHDTLLIKETIIRPGETVTDTTAIGKYISDYFENAIEIEEPKKIAFGIAAFVSKN